VGDESLRTGGPADEENGELLLDGQSFGLLARPVVGLLVLLGVPNQLRRSFDQLVVAGHLRTQDGQRGLDLVAHHDVALGCAEGLEVREDEGLARLAQGLVDLACRSWCRSRWSRCRRTW
jgi:hypothetical protein